MFLNGHGFVFWDVDGGGDTLTAKIENLYPTRLAWRTLLHQMLERDDVEAVVCAVRIDGRWETAWGNEAHSGLCMAAMKLMADVTDWIHSSPEDGR